MPTVAASGGHSSLSAPLPTLPELAAKRECSGTFMPIPPIISLKQTTPQPVVADVAREVRRQWRESSLPRRLKAGARVAVGVGSRGIAGIQVIVRATLDSLKEMGYRPFLVAAMGSHGGATAEGQRQLLGEYGISEKE